MRRNEDRLPVLRGQDRGLSRMVDTDLFSPTSFFSTSPWQMMRRMQEDMDRIFGQFFTEAPGAGTQAGLEQWRPNVDISQNNKEWCVEAELPGVNKDDIDVQVQDHHLILRAEMKKEQQDEGEGRQYHHRERRYGFFERVLPLPENVDEEHIACDFKDGVLTLHLPKLEQAKQEPRRIPITAGGTGAEAATAPAKETKTSKEAASTGTQEATMQKKAA